MGDPRLLKACAHVSSRTFNKVLYRDLNRHIATFTLITVQIGTI